MVLMKNLKGAVTTVLDKLHKDHINFSKLLVFLENQLKLLEDCESPDLNTMVEAIEYMKNYPDLIHHPLENVVFQYYLDHYDSKNKDVHHLMEEHEEMPLLTNKLLGILASILADVPQERTVLCDNLKAYINAQKEHMNAEEAKIYPQLSSSLNEQDWKNINSELVDVEDPLFGQQVAQSYQRLRLHI